MQYRRVYSGVDLVYYGNQGGQLEYDFVVAPGAEPHAITLDVGAGLVPARRGHPQGAPLRVADDGDLMVKTNGGEVRFHKPVTYQTAAAGQGQLTTDHRQRTPVESHDVLTASNHVRFALSPYDHTKPLFIDPILTYSTYLWGSGSDSAVGIAVDASGNAYLTGGTSSTDFPTLSPEQASLNGPSDPFVAKLSATSHSASRRQGLAMTHPLSRLDGVHFGWALPEYFEKTGAV